MISHEELSVLQTVFQRFAVPTTYVVLDTETTGVDTAADYLVDVGWLLVQQGKITHRGNMLLDWSSYQGYAYDVYQRLEQQGQQYAAKGKLQHYTYSRLQLQGIPAAEVLTQYCDFIDWCLVSGIPIVGHGFWWFDRQVLNSHLARFFPQRSLSWHSNAILDTGLLEKAIQLGEVPWVGDFADDWYTRVEATVARVKWSLEGHCIPKYQLADVTATTQKAHTAEYDCWMIHRLLQTYCYLASGSV